MKIGAKLVMSALVAAQMVVPAMGQETGESCAIISDGAQRLACYDAIFRTDAPDLPDMLTFQSEQMIPAKPSGRKPATFSVACIDGATEVRFAFAGQPMSATSDIAPITLQVDQGVTQVRTVQASADNTSVSFGSQREVEAFLDTLNGGEKLKVRATPVRQRSLNVTFRLTEALGPIGALREACR